MAAISTACSKCIIYVKELRAQDATNKILHQQIEELKNKVKLLNDTNDKVLEKLSDRLMKLEDYNVKMNDLEKQLQYVVGQREIKRFSRREVNSFTDKDVKHIHPQLVLKDKKIIELNNMVLEKEKQILDLQEMCREQKELVQAKAKASHIMQQRLVDLESRTTREGSTETETAYLFDSSVLSSRPQKEYQRDSASPGCAVQLKIGGSGSPPPVDPSEEYSSIAQDNIHEDIDGDDANVTSCSFQKKKQRKKVTFFLPPQKEFRDGKCFFSIFGKDVDDDIAQAIIDLTTENDQLRKTIQKMETCADDTRNQICQLQIQLDEANRESRNQVLKARASMQSKVRDLEDKIASLTADHAVETKLLNAATETLKADREWTMEENTRLLELLDSRQEKLQDAWEAIDKKGKEYDKIRSKLLNDRALIVRLGDDLEKVQGTANALLEQKISILDDVERLKEALEAQDQYIDLLEKDTVIYENHIGLLRDSLGASKIEKRELIKSKVSDAKLKALEQEKDKIKRRRNG
ncbi:unnamed protein product [Thelazia callipaeda]|uniref:Coiled-coil domain-containing protein 39 n=1 Tax=Thelazia callipaeda TaxID=103827 RepID=A0A158RBI9_THECL|nr:unnamed protein product [Thelazia callipaeda]